MAFESILPSLNGDPDTYVHLARTQFEGSIPPKIHESRPGATRSTASPPSASTAELARFFLPRLAQRSAPSPAPPASSPASPPASPAPSPAPSSAAAPAPPLAQQSQHAPQTLPDSTPLPSPTQLNDSLLEEVSDSGHSLEIPADTAESQTTDSTIVSAPLLEPIAPLEEVATVPLQEVTNTRRPHTRAVTAEMTIHCPSCRTDMTNETVQNNRTRCDGCGLLQTKSTRTCLSCDIDFCSQCVLQHTITPYALVSLSLPIKEVGIPEQLNLSDRQECDEIVDYTPANKYIYDDPNNPVRTPENRKERKQLKHYEIVQWTKSENAEIEAITNNGVIAEISWEQLRPGEQVIPTRFVYTKKAPDETGLCRLKSRLVALGHLDKSEVYDIYSSSPTSRQAFFKAIVILALTYRLCLAQCDISTAFLRAPIYDKDVFIKIKEKCYQLKKALYGLAESSARWHFYLADQLELYGLKQSKFDPCLFVKQDASNNVTMAVHVDDMLVAADEKDRIRATYNRKTLSMRSLMKSKSQRAKSAAYLQAPTNI